MKTNELVALKNSLDANDNQILKIYESTSNNRANNMGDALEYYAKDIFCSTLDVDNFSLKDTAYSNYLSYIGNSNNPPDFIVSQSAAIEVKKLENLSFSPIPLNSSYPKDYLYSSSTLINTACRNCEDEYGGWDKKDMIYVIGNILKGTSKLKMLWILDGKCYCADREIYDRIKTTIKLGIQQIQGVEFVANTKELGKVKKIDPLGLTDLRIRGMWNIKHPMKAFDYLVQDYDNNTNFQIYCLILKTKYDILPKIDKENLSKYIDNKILTKEDVKIKNPNNPAKWIDAVLYKASL